MLEARFEVTVVCHSGKVKYYLKHTGTDVEEEDENDYRFCVDAEVHTRFDHVEGIMNYLNSLLVKATRVLKKREEE